MIADIRLQFSTSLTGLSATWRQLVDVSVWRAASGSVRLSALVFVEVQLLQLLLQEGNGHGAAATSLRQRVDLGHIGDTFLLLTNAPSLKLLGRFL